MPPARPLVAIVVAAAENGVIGHQGKLPWDLPDDWAQFRQRVAGHPVLMGRKTFEALTEDLGATHYVVITRQTDWHPAGATVVPSLPAALQAANAAPRVYLIGGGQIYAEALAQDLVDEVYLTRVHGRPAGDAHFPALDARRWQRTSALPHPVDERHNVPFTIETWIRRS